MSEQRSFTLYFLASLTVLITLFHNTVFAQKPRENSKNVILEGFSSTRLLPINELVNSSAKIFTGKVSEVVLSRLNSIKVIKITFDVNEILYNENQDETPRQLTIYYQVPIVFSHVRKGDDVLWFLSGESMAGLSMPIGYSSGYFVKTPAGLYENLFGNHGLWKNNLWEIVSREKIESLLSEQAEIKNSNALSILLEIGDKPPNGPLPIDLLRVIVLALKP